MKKTLDIGVGKTPYFIRYEIPCSTEGYIAVDSQQNFLDESKKKVESFSQEELPATMHFMVANATSLPLPDGLFDSVILSNVLSAPIHTGWDYKDPAHTLRGFGMEDLFYKERKKIISEALRVLKDSGKLVIYTDLIIYGQYSYEAIMKELGESAFAHIRALEDEQVRVDLLNRKKVSSGAFCHCFMADLLPRSSVYEVTKLSSYNNSRKV